MATLVFESTIQKLAYQFTITGDIIPWVKIYPHIASVDGRVITAIPLLPSVMTEDINYPEGLYIGDKVKLCIEQDGQSGYWSIAIEPGTGEIGEYIDLTIRNCPICGEPLHPSQYGFGACFNRCCRGQRASTLLLFASSLGLTFIDAHRYIFDALVVRGALSSPSDLFRVTEDDACFQGISKIDIQSFLRYIHSIRGRVSIGQLLRSLNIPNITDVEINTIDAHFQVRGLPMSTFIFMIQNPDIEPIMPLKTIREFVIHPQNMQLLTELCIILG